MASEHGGEGNSSDGGSLRLSCFVPCVSFPPRSLWFAVYPTPPPRAARLTYNSVVSWCEFMLRWCSAAADGLSPVLSRSLSAAFARRRCGLSRTHPPPPTNQTPADTPTGSTQRRTANTGRPHTHARTTLTSGRRATSADSNKAASSDRPLCRRSDSTALTHSTRPLQTQREENKKAPTQAPSTHTTAVKRRGST